MNYIWKLSQLNNIKKNGHNVFSCFSCGGGSSMGYKLSGFEVLGNCEIDPAMNKLYLQNIHPKYNFLMGVQDFWKLENVPDELMGIDILDGSPPCSTFSMCGAREKYWGKEKKFKEGQAKQVLSDLFFEYIQVCNRLKPKIVVAENVKGIILGNAKSYMNAILKAFDEIGYEMQVFLLNASNMGVPQRRERVFFIGRRKDLNLPKLTLAFNEKPIFYKDFVDSEYIPINTETELYKRWMLRRSKDTNIGDVVSRTEKNKISGFSNSFLKLNEVPCTLTAGGGFVRFDVPGYPSKKDIISIQSFPQDYDFLDQNATYVCGMSVPPIMMHKISEQIEIQLLSKI